MPDLKLYWESVQNAVSYTIFWNTSPGVTPSNSIPIFNITSIVFFHKNLQENTTYYYIVVANDLNGNMSPPSIEFGATTSKIISLNIIPSGLTIPVNTTQQYKAYLLYSDEFLQDVTSSTTWDTDNHTIATMDVNGLLTGISMGTVHVQANHLTFSNTTNVFVSNILISIVVTPANDTINALTTLQYTAIGHFNDLSSADITDVVSWSSSNASAATVSNTLGMQGLTAAGGGGSTTISALSGVITGSTNLSITALLTSISISPINPSIIYPNTQQFTATGHYSDGSAVDLTNSVTWMSGNTGAATISSSGLATSVHNGTANISTTFGLFNNNTTLTVTHIVSSISVTPSSKTLFFLANTQQFSASAIYNDGDALDVTSIATWASSSPSVATINAAGLATPVAFGTTGITATYNAITSNSASLVIATWQQQTSGTSVTLNGVWGFSPTNVYAVGNSGTVLHWDGASWTQQAIGTAANLLVVQGPDSGHVYITASDDFVYYTHNNGTTWNQITNKPFPGSGGFVATSIWANSSTDLWAKQGAISGGSRLVYSSNESTWTTDQGNSSLAGEASVLYGFGPNDMFCGTNTDHSKILRFTGGTHDVTGWTLLSTTLGTLATNMGNVAFGMNSFWGTSDSNLYMSGQFFNGGGIFYSTDLFNTYTAWSNSINTTSISSGSNGQSLPQSIINVASTTGPGGSVPFPSSGTLRINSSLGVQTITYTGSTSTSFIGCSGGSGTLSTGNTVVSGNFPSGAENVSGISGSNTNNLVYASNQNSNDNKFYVLAYLNSGWFYDFAQAMGNGSARSNAVWIDETSGYGVAVGDQGIIIKKG